MKLSEFDFNLPPELIAQTPIAKRDHSRLMILDRKTGIYSHTYFYNIIDFLNYGDVLVRNNTKVIPARLFGTKALTNAAVEVLLLNNIKDDYWECLVGNAKTIKLNSEIVFSSNLKAICTEVKTEGIRVLKMLYQGVFLEILDELGETPLPPYIKMKLADKTRYQTVYAKTPGSAAAPTAGFHFTEELISTLINKGVKIVDVTLHVGLATFRPIKVEDVEKHIMHGEYYHVSKESAEILEAAKKHNKRIIAVGTTSARTLEHIIKKHHKFVADTGFTDIFIYPGFKFEAIDGLITNFHLPKSSLLLLVSAFATKDIILKTYQEAVVQKYRFFSFGDAMFIK